MSNKVTVMLSNRHIHLSTQLQQELFGDKGLTIKRYLTQGKTEYAAEETVTVKGPKGYIEHVRILGPARSYTQIELLKADKYVLGVTPPIRESGDLDDAVDLTIVCNGKEYPVPKCGILAFRHIHMYSVQMEKLGLQEKQLVSVRVGGERGLVFNNVLIRRSRSAQSIMHVDVEEANAANISNGDLVEVIV